MYGVVAAVIAVNRPGILWISILFVVNLIIIFSSRKLLGKGDVNSLGWCILGLGVLNLASLYIFLLFFVFFVLVFVSCKYIFDVHGKTPGMIVVFGSFLVTVIVPI